MKWLIRILFILVAVVGLVIGTLLLMPGDKLSAILVEQVKSHTGRDLKLSGDVRLSFWPVLGMETGPVTFGNAPWAGPDPMLSASSLSVGVDASALLSGDIRIRRVLAENPVLRLEVSEGRGNWVMSAPQADSPPIAKGKDDSGETAITHSPTKSGAVTLDWLELDRARLIFIENGVTSMDFAQVDLTATWPDPTDPLKMNASMPVPGGSVDVTLEIPNLPAFSAGEVTPLTVNMNAPGGQITFGGRVNLAGEMEGKTRVRTSNTDTMLAAFGQGGVSVPLGLGRKADISSQMTYTRDGRISLREMQAVLDHNRFDGAADIIISDPPQITARLKAENLDLTKAIGGGGSKSKGAGGKSGGDKPDTDGWSKAPIDASPLALANGSIRLKAKSIAIPDMTFGPSDITVNLNRSRAVLKMNPATLFSGRLTGQVVANNRNGLSVGGKLKAKGVDLKQALTALVGVERLSGTASGNIEFLGVGQTEDQIMRSLSGKGTIDVGKGIISGFDLDRLMGRSAGTGGTTVFNSLTATYIINKGNLMNEDLLMQLDNFRADGAGRVGLGKRDIDYLFTPVALRANGGKGVSVPVHIKGPWSNPSIKPDLSKVVEAATEEKVQELEQDAKSKALKKVGEELDTTITDSEQIEDALKKKLEDEAKKGLLKLLGD
ncbi:MAG: AsmA family protein [Ruegeria sp.]